MQNKNIWARRFRNLWTTLWSIKACLIKRDKQSRMQNIIPICFVFWLGTIFGLQIGEKNNKHWQLYLSTIHAVITLEHFSWIFLWTRTILLFTSYICIRQQPKNAELFKFCRQICWKLFIIPKHWIFFFFYISNIFNNFFSNSYMFFKFNPT